MIGKQLDKMVMERISTVRESGGIIDRHTVQCIGTGVLSVKAPESMKANGGSIELTDAWAKSLLYRMGYKKRAATTGKLQLPEG